MAGRTTHIAATVLLELVAAVVATVVEPAVAAALVGAIVGTSVAGAAVLAGAWVAVDAWAQAARAAALNAPSTTSASRRLSTRPIGRSSLSISILHKMQCI